MDLEGSPLVSLLGRIDSLESKVGELKDLLCEFLSRFPAGSGLQNVKLMPAVLSIEQAKQVDRYIDFLNVSQSRGSAPQFDIPTPVQTPRKSPAVGEADFPKLEPFPFADPSPKHCGSLANVLVVEKNESLVVDLAVPALCDPANLPETIGTCAVSPDVDLTAIAVGDPNVPVLPPGLDDFTNVQHDGATVDGRSAAASGDPVVLCDVGSHCVIEDSIDRTTVGLSASALRDPAALPVVTNRQVVSGRLDADAVGLLATAACDPVIKSCDTAASRLGKQKRNRRKTRKSQLECPRKLGCGFSPRQMPHAAFDVEDDAITLPVYTDTSFAARWDDDNEWECPASYVKCSPDVQDHFVSSSVDSSNFGDLESKTSPLAFPADSFTGSCDASDCEHSKNSNTIDLSSQLDHVCGTVDSISGVKFNVMDSLDTIESKTAALGFELCDVMSIFTVASRLAQSSSHSIAIQSLVDEGYLKPKPSALNMVCTKSNDLKDSAIDPPLAVPANSFTGNYDARDNKHLMNLHSETNEPAPSVEQSATSCCMFECQRILDALVEINRRAIECGWIKKDDHQRDIVAIQVALKRIDGEQLVRQSSIEHVNAQIKHLMENIQCKFPKVLLADPTNLCADGAISCAGSLKDQLT